MVYLRFSPARLQKRQSSKQRKSQRSECNWFPWCWLAGISGTIQATLFVSHLQSRGCVQTQKGQPADLEEIFTHLTNNCFGWESLTGPLTPKQLDLYNFLSSVKTSVIVEHVISKPWALICCYCNWNLAATVRSNTKALVKYKSDQPSSATRNPFLYERIFPSVHMYLVIQCIM